MKLQQELETIENAFRDNLDTIKEYAPRLKETGKYNDYDTRLAWDCLYAFIGSAIICSWYSKYNCHDTHITTVGKQALRNLAI